MPSHLYSFSFAPGHPWSRRYAPQAEILDYLQETVRRFDLGPHLRFGTDVISAEFRADAGRWLVEIADGDVREFDLLITACGQLTTPDVPSVPGLDNFTGPRFHSAKWDHGLDLHGKRVAVLGTGASAIQFIPPVAEEVESMAVYQRSAPWILPKMDRRYPRWEQRSLWRLPGRLAASRAGTFSFMEAATYGFTGTDWMMGPLKAAANRYRDRVLTDPELRRLATPDYEIGCKRVLFTSDWYPAIARPNVELLSGSVQRVTPTGVIGPDGVERPADVIIFGTGFRSHDFVAPMQVRGLDGLDLNELWATKPEAHMGTAVSGFPNMFVLYGPNTNHGSGSVIYTLESQFNQVIDAIARLRDGHLRYLAVRPEAQRRWQEEIDRRSVDTVWLKGGCANWYVNELGQNTNNWPGPWLEYRRRTRRIDPAEYEFMA